MGWVCTREQDHDGPCAAHPIKDYLESKCQESKLDMVRLKRNIIVHRLKDIGLGHIAVPESPVPIPWGEGDDRGWKVENVYLNSGISHMDGKPWVEATYLTEDAYVWYKRINSPCDLLEVIESTEKGLNAKTWYGKPKKPRHYHYRLK